MIPIFKFIIKELSKTINQPKIQTAPFNRIKIRVINKRKAIYKNKIMNQMNKNQIMNLCLI